MVSTLFYRLSLDLMNVVGFMSCTFKNKNNHHHILYHRFKGPQDALIIAQDLMVGILTTGGWLLKVSGMERLMTS
jgi:hypothetical protein